MYGEDAVGKWVNTRNQLLDAATKKVFTNSFMQQCGLAWGSYYLDEQNKSGFIIASLPIFQSTIKQVRGTSYYLVTRICFYFRKRALQT